jgi:MioC protein
MIKLQIIVGTVNGKAWQTARAIARVLEHLGHEARVNDEPRAQDLKHDPDEVILVCCSTTGEGELPRNIYSLFLALDDQAIDLKGRYYGVIALGDSSYRHFAQAGFMMENALYLSGAKRVGEMFILDSKKDNNHPLSAAQWASQWINEIPV